MYIETLYSVFLIFELISFRTWSKTSVDFPLKNISDPKNVCGPTFNDSIFLCYQYGMEYQLEYHYKSTNV